MPERRTMQRARRAKAAGKAPTTQAGGFVKKVLARAKSRKLPVKRRKQAVAIGLSKARRSGVAVPAKPAARKKKVTTRKRATATKRPAVKRGTARRAPSNTRVSARTTRVRTPKRTTRRTTSKKRSR